MPHLVRHNKAPLIIVAVAAGLWAGFVGQLAVSRHMNLMTNAFDLGYVSQALWYDGHGEPFRFTTIQGVSTILEGLDPARILHPHWLLAFHVEPALLLLAPVYSIWSDPRPLLWIQAAVLAAGALAVAPLAGRLIGGKLAMLAFGLAYLLAPGLEGAALSDFHMVAIGAALLMAGLWLLETGRPRWALACLALTVLSREDGALAVAGIGVALLVGRPERRRLGLGLAAGAGAWALICFGIVEPFFSGGASAFSGRYAWLAHNPLALVSWLASGDVRAYLGLQLLAAGVVGLLAPAELLAAVPLVAINALSAFEWMRSGGGHYSALLVPLLLWAAMHGVRRAKVRLGETGARAATSLALASAVVAQAWAGASPLRPGFAWPESDPRAPSVLVALQAIPSEASVKATSALYPHLSARHDAYWFPARANADWLALDTAGGTHPLSPAEMRDATINALSRPGTQLVEAREGVIVATIGSRDGLLSDDPADRSFGQVLRNHPEALPPEFYGFATMPGPVTPLGTVRFGSSLELVGYQLRRWPEVGLFGNAATLTTFWRAGDPIPEDLRFALATTRSSDGALSGLRHDAAAAPLWWPTSRWQPNQLMRLEMSLDRTAGIQALGVSVDDSQGRRLQASGGTLWDGGAIVAVARL